jgi:uroporphyrin-III C-methyltransferase
VYLVGAGPGDPDLLTLKAVKALQRADVVLCDELVSAEVLAHGNPNARVVHVGKRGGGKSTPQAFIERLMVAEARAGRIVARLKGGDPMIFGRGGEECAALERSGIGYEVVNGITSGLAAATALGIPLTHRDAGQGAILLTGHERAEAAIDWEALVRTGMPLVVYMGVARCEAIVAALLAAGMDPSMPAAAVENASRPDARQLVSRLDALPASMRAAGIGSPAILIVGRTVPAVQAELGERLRALP